MRDEEIIAVVQAHFDGEQIQARQIGGVHGWSSCVPLVKWNFAHYDYRVKPEPLELWVNIWRDERMSTYTNATAALNASGANVRKTVHMVAVDD